MNNFIYKKTFFCSIILLPLLLSTQAWSTEGSSCVPNNDRWIDIQSCGAKGDDNTDDRKAIQQAIDALKCSNEETDCVSGGTVFFPAGEYSIQGPLEADVDNLRMRGESPNKSKIIFNPPNDEIKKIAIIVQKGDDTADLIPTRGVKIEWLEVKVKNGKDETNDKSSQAIIQLNTCINCEIVDVSIYWDGREYGAQNGLDGIGVSAASKNITIKRTVVEGMGKTGVWIAWASNVEVDQVTSNNNGAGGIGVGRVTNARLSNLEAHDNALIGIGIEGMGGTDDAHQGAPDNILISHAIASGNGKKCLGNPREYYWCRANEAGKSTADTAGVRIASANDFKPTLITILHLESFDNYDHGLQIQDGKELLIVQPKLHHNYFSGMLIESNIGRLLESIKVIDPLIYNNNTITKKESSKIKNKDLGGIILSSAEEISIIGGKIFDNQCVPTQKQGIYLYSREDNPNHPNARNKIDNLRIIDVNVRTDRELVHSYAFNSKNFTINDGYYRIAHPNTPTGLTLAPKNSDYVDLETGCRYVKKEQGWDLQNEECNLNQ